jgi:hypothetical protein
LGGLRGSGVATVEQVATAPIQFDGAGFFSLTWIKAVRRNWGIVVSASASMAMLAIFARCSFNDWRPSWNNPG